MPRLVRGDVRGEMVGIDGDDNRSPLLEDCFPRTGRVDLDRHPDQPAHVLPHVGIRVIGGYGLDALAVSRQQDDRAKVSRRAGDVLGDDREQRIHVWNRVAESI